MFAFVGVGQAGGNIANLARKKGIKAVAINYSKNDLELDSIESKLRLVGTEGVGKRRDVAIAKLPDNIDAIEKFFENNFSTPSIEIVIVTFAVGGGTGSGIGPLLIELLQHQMPEKVIVGCPILPSYSEPYHNQFNTVEASEELSKLNIAIYPVDNQKRYTEVGKESLYRTVNEELVSIFYELQQYTSRHSEEGVLDRTDLREIFKTPGVGVIAKVELAQLNSGQENNVTEEGVAKRIQESWESSIFVSPEKEKLTSAGIIFDGQESLMRSISQKKIFEVFETEPFYVYQGNYRNESGKVTTIIAGMQWYQNRLKEIEKSFDGKKLSLGNEAREGYKSSIKLEFKKEENTQKQMSALEILNKYKKL
ncbi:cell division protein FtsZ [Radiobacillus sp. PE A8.2]|uniref:cell division protein FtsZ n=1 Tax=Radiobacillus sp. PE A8.2 TaxID=3380349 RepID=UPI00388F8F74